MGELQSFRSRSDLVVFSTCGIGSGEEDSWYRITGFPQNFLKAGAGNVIFSLWNVSDLHAHHLMLDFYREHLEGESYASALRKAKLKMLKTQETSSPTLWAPFVLWSD